MLTVLNVMLKIPVILVWTVTHKLVPNNAFLMNVMPVSLNLLVENVLLVSITVISVKLKPLV
jgi:hypothetical protein